MGLPMITLIIQGLHVNRKNKHDAKMEHIVDDVLDAQYVSRYL